MRVSGSDSYTLLLLLVEEQVIISDILVEVSGLCIQRPAGQ